MFELRWIQLPRKKIELIRLDKSYQHRSGRLNGRLSGSWLSCEKILSLADNGLPHGDHLRLRETFLNHCYRKCGGQNWVVQRRRRSFDSRQSRVAKLSQLTCQTPRAVPQLQIDQPAQFLQASNGLQKKGNRIFNTFRKNSACQPTLDTIARNIQRKITRYRTFSLFDCFRFSPGHIESYCYVIVLLALRILKHWRSFAGKISYMGGGGTRVHDNQWEGALRDDLWMMDNGKPITWPSNCGRVYWACLYRISKNANFFRQPEDFRQHFRFTESLITR